MKEATGELNATVVVAITIGLLSTFFFTVLWPMLRGNLKSNTNCSKAICTPEAKKNCHKGTNGVCETVDCYVMDGDNKIDVKCPYKG